MPTEQEDRQSTHSAGATDAEPSQQGPRSPVKETLQKVTRGAEIVAYHLPDDFDALWKMETQTAPLIIVWNETPSDPDLDPVRCENVLSPIDWAIAYAKIRENEEVEALTQELETEQKLIPQQAHARAREMIRETPWPNILILDLQPDSNKTAPLYRQLGQMRKDLLPWLHVYAAPNILLAEIRKFVANANDKTKAPEIETEHRDAHKSLLRSARMTLAEGGSEAEVSRHAIANIVGPMILRGGKSATQHTNSLHAPALKTLLEACDLVRAADKPDSQEEIDTTGLHLVLVDDQAEHGWEDWLREITTGGTIEVMTSPAPILNSLKEALEPGGEPNKNNWPKDLRFQYDPGTTTPAGSQPVLLLDLRLFSGDVAGERKFLKDQLLPLIKKHFLDHDNTAWPSFRNNNKRFTAARAAVERDPWVTDSVNYLEALTWLPRVLALADMSLPIILFSSTGRRTLVQPLTDFRNIISTFNKPRFFEATTEAEESAEYYPKKVALSFRMAVEEAKEISKARQEIARISKVKITANNLLSTAAKAFHHFEIYLDESSTVEDRNFKVGGLLVCYPSAAEAEKFQSASQGPLKWNAPQKKDRLPKRVEGRTGTPLGVVDSDFTLWSRIVAKVQEIRRDRQLSFMIIPFIFKRPTPASPSGTSSSNISSAWDRKGLDNMIVEMLRVCIESLLFEILGSAVNANSKVEIYGATRERYIPLNRKTTARDIFEARSSCGDTQEFIDTKRAWKDLWGFLNARPEATETNEHPGEYNLYCAVRTFFPHSLYSLITDVMNGRRQSALREALVAGIEKAICVYLTYTELPPDQELVRRHATVRFDAAGRVIDVDKPTVPNRYSRTFHYIADYAMYISSRFPKAYDNCNLFEHLIEERCSGNLVFTLSAARWLDYKELENTLLAFSLVDDYYKSEIGESVRTKINGALDDLCGRTFRNFATLLTKNKKTLAEEVNIFRNLV